VKLETGNLIFEIFDITNDFDNLDTLENTDH